MNTRILFTHALSPLHAGTGQSVGAVDLAIARDKATNHPYLPGSSLKGSLRARAYEQMTDRAQTLALFGPETEQADSHAGVLAFGDANLLLLPVRSLRGTFAWVTSPLLLARFKRDLLEIGRNDVPAMVSVVNETRCHVSSAALKVKDKVIFEDLDLTAEQSLPVVGAWATLIGDLLFAEDDFWRASLRERFCVVHDDVMSFLCEHATQVVTRVALDLDSKTVRQGGLWQEESLPVETVLYSLVLVSPNEGARQRWAKLNVDTALSALADLCATPIQLGGKATVGRGRCRLVMRGAQ
ncbi:type III-B CRISPR module RAMP protein Cmr4 [Myxococcota bacterium]|nr:type III-B CRISPR module RAMP protein Cmr4 [Myxococcota bacterium]